MNHWLRLAPWQLFLCLLLPFLLLPGLASAALLGLFLQADDMAGAALWHDVYLWRVWRFTWGQAALSTGLSVFLAIPIACALLRRPQFPGRSLLLRSMEVTLVLPALVAVLGLISVYGREGVVGQLSHMMGFAWSWRPYGLDGIVLAHLFFNVPLVARLLLQALERQPREHWLLVSQLGLGRSAIWRTLEWPVIRQYFPGLGALVFTLCFTSFAIVLTLGGGPGATTLEVAIYQALRFDNEPGQAAFLALIQLTSCALIWLWSHRRIQGVSLTAPCEGNRPHRPDQGGLAWLSDGFSILILVGLIWPPLVLVIGQGISGLPALWSQSLIWAALGRSLVIACGAAIVAVVLALSLQSGIRQLRLYGYERLGQWLAVSGRMTLMVPAMVLGTGLFVLLKPWVLMVNQSLFWVALFNGLMAVPFVLQSLPAVNAQPDHGPTRLLLALGIRGWARWRWWLWPQWRGPIGLSLGYAMALSLGDFGVIALLGMPSEPTLTQLLHQQLGHYRTEGAAATAVTLLLVQAGGFMFWRYCLKPVRT